MIRFTTTALLVLALPPALGARADDKPKGETPAEQVKALEREFADAQANFMKEYRAAKTAQERQKLFQEKYPQPAKYAARFMKLAEEHAKDPAAVQALTWVVKSNAHQMGKDSVRNKALDLLVRDHLQSDQLDPVCTALARAFDAAAGKFLDTVLEKNPHRNVQAAACLALGQRLDARIQMHERFSNNPQMARAYESMLGKDDAEALQKLDADKTRTEAVKYFERVVKDYADVKDAQGHAPTDAAQSQLDGLRHPIAVGKAAPEVKGEDVDGKKFTLSDYKGKVVLLDFWGNW